MDDVIYTGQITDLNPIVAKIEWKTGNTLMILECLQTGWVDKDERNNLICFEHFNVEQNFNNFQEGRIFDPEKELAWSQFDNGQFQVIYSGAEADLPDLPELQSAEAEWECSEPVKYMLWGRSLKTEPVFLELQIPRLLAYPFSCEKDKTRIALKMIEYQDKNTCQTQHYRFLRLEEV